MVTGEINLFPASLADPSLNHSLCRSLFSAIADQANFLKLSVSFDRLARVQFRFLEDKADLLSIYSRQKKTTTRHELTQRTTFEAIPTTSCRSLSVTRIQICR